MADSTNWPAVPYFANGNNVDADTLNAPIRQLAARTDHLLRLLQQNDRTKVAIVGAQLSNKNDYGTPGVGAVVYRASDGTYAKAKGSSQEDAWFYASQEAMAVGVVASVSGTVGTVVLCGYIAFSDGGIAAADVIADANPVSGRYYLSNTVPGKLTANPTGPIVYVCDCQVSGTGNVTSMLVNPQYRDTGESHVHRSFVLDWKPQGGYSYKSATTYAVYGVLPDGFAPSSSGSVVGAIRIHIGGAWDTDSNITYVFTLAKKSASVSAGSTNWADYKLVCTSSGDSVTSFELPLDDLAGATATQTQVTSYKSVGTHQMKVRAVRPPGNLSDYSPAAMLGNASRNTWTVSMPDAGRGWLEYNNGFFLNLGMYPAMANYIPLVPSNSGSLVVNGIELRGPVFGTVNWGDDDDNRQWYIDNADAGGGPYLRWLGKDVVADSDTTPWVHKANGQLAEKRHIVLHVGRMRVGPTGFVTSLQPAPGSPLRITSALTDSDAVQGALQIGLDVDFKSGGGGAAGSQVVKRIEGTTFVTGPVVERVVAGPGISVNQEQGIVRLSSSNAVYAGDFETIALKNAKQDLAGGVFPYTKLLGSNTGIASGFTAKFRVPDHIPYNVNHGYWVVVSASVFGEESLSGSGEATASFSLEASILGDQACSADAVSGVFGGSISSPVVGKADEVVGVQFSRPYTAFDPVLVHGFKTASGDAGPGSIALPDTESRRSVGALWLKSSVLESNGANSGVVGYKPLVVYPGYFVGLSIQRCQTSGTDYAAPIGFMSLRWNLVEVPA